LDDVRSLDSEAAKILVLYDQKRAAVLPLLRLAQEKAGFVSPEAEAWVSEHTGVPLVHVHEATSFYTMFHVKPHPKHHIRFCCGTSCMLRGSEERLAYLKEKLGVRDGVSSDGLVFVEESECLCACETAPMMQVDDRYVGDLDSAKIDAELDKIRKDAS